MFKYLKTKYFFAGTCYILPYCLPPSLSLSWASYLNLTLHSIFPNVTEICKLKCWALCWIIGYWNLNSNILPSTYLATTTNTPAHNKYIVHSSEERVEWESAVLELESVKNNCWQFWHWCTYIVWRRSLLASSISISGRSQRGEGNRCLNGKTLIEL